MKTILLFSFALLLTGLCAFTFATTSIGTSNVDNLVNSVAADVEKLANQVAFSDDGKPYLTKEFTLNGDGNLHVETSGGNITVVGGSGNQVKVEMFARLNGNRDSDKTEVKEELDKYDITIKQDGNTITATAKRKASFRSQRSHLSLSFSLYTPANMASQLETSGGNISLANLTGTQEAETSGGNITTENLKGNLSLETSGGNLTSTNVSGDVKMETSGGNIRLTKCHGKWNAQTSGGNIDVTDAQGELKVATSGGQINLKGMSGSLDARTSGGGIEADIVELGKYLTLETSGGSIEATIPGGKGLDLDLEGDRVKTTLNNFSGTSEKDRIVGKMNGGGIPVKMTTSGSTVVLNYR
ncbi:MAG: hypothetical protein V4714_06750 [Bacteroidota bacterium]